MNESSCWVHLEALEAMFPDMSAVEPAEIVKALADRQRHLDALQRLDLRGLSLELRRAFADRLRRVLERDELLRNLVQKWRKNALDDAMRVRDGNLARAGYGRSSAPEAAQIRRLA